MHALGQGDFSLLHHYMYCVYTCLQEAILYKLSYDKHHDCARISFTCMAKHLIKASKWSRPASKESFITHYLQSWSEQVYKSVLAKK